MEPPSMTSESDILNPRQIKHGAQKRQMQMISFRKHLQSPGISIRSRSVLRLYQSLWCEEIELDYSVF